MSSLQFLPQGALIQEFSVGGQNIVLGFPDPESYPAVRSTASERYARRRSLHVQKSQFFGETIGRVANRIKDGRVSANGKTYQVGRHRRKKTGR